MGGKSIGQCRQAVRWSGGEEGGGSVLRVEVAELQHVGTGLDRSAEQLNNKQHQAARQAAVGQSVRHSTRQLVKGGREGGAEQLQVSSLLLG